MVRLGAVTSFSCSFRWRYCRFCESSRLVSSFFCWPRMCCWNFFSSASATLVFGDMRKQGQVVRVELVSLH